MLKSWWKRTVILLAAIFLAAALFFAWTSYNYSHQIRETIIEENSRSAQMWAKTIESRTSTIYEHVYELMIALYNNTELRADTPIMNAQTKIKIVDMMNDKLLVSNDADAFFVFDTQNDFFLFSAKSSLAGMNVLALKEYTHLNALEQAVSFGNTQWKIITVNGVDYFFKSVKLGKYTVGAVSDCAYYNIEDNFSVLGEDISCQVLISDTYYNFGNVSSLSGKVIEDGAKEGYYRGLVTVKAKVSALGGTVILAARPDSFAGRNWMSTALVADSAICVIMVVLLLFILRRDVARPTSQLIMANKELASGNTQFRLDTSSAGSGEFEALYESFNNMAEQIVRLRIEAYDMKLEEEQNKLTMLRAQIKPHSFLNAVTTISNMTYINKPEEIRAYISAFAKFMRYMLKVASPWTTVEDEIDHIRNYLKMQETRFPGSINCTVECDPSVVHCNIPFLMLFTLVENSIKHAMTLYETMELTLRCERFETEDFKGVRLIEEDNGEGFSDEAMAELLNDDPNSIFAKEHLGMSNVRYTLNLIYNRSDLLHISNRECGGAHIEIWIPDEEEKHETFDLR
ncbi:MAG: histidine kinase [Oscillospiraceae bacterium]|nr:histidine kinase [Oscillospiraceae bacterium]